MEQSETNPMEEINPDISSGTENGKEAEIPNSIEVPRSTEKKSQEEVGSRLIKKAKAVWRRGDEARSRNVKN